MLDVEVFRCAGRLLRAEEVSAQRHGQKLWAYVEKKRLMGFGMSAGDLGSLLSEGRTVLMGELLVVLHLRSFWVSFFF